MAAAFALATVYAAAFLGKYRARREFVEYLRGAVGKRSTALAAFTLALEACLATGLAAAAVMPAIRLAVGVCSAGFLVAATAFHATVLAEGKASSCQCFGRPSRFDLEPSWHPAVIAARNSALAALSLGMGGVSVYVAAAPACGIPIITGVGLGVSIWRERSYLHRNIHPLYEPYAAAAGNKLLQAHTWWVNGHPRDF